MKNHTDLLNFLAERYQLKSYLEIGVNVKNNNFDHINCPLKIGVDPKISADATYKMTSDEYFSIYKDKKFDLIFIDGLHWWEQVKKDFENSLNALTDQGFIVFHDCNPTKEEYSHYPRDKRGVWNGDVYKFILTLTNYPNINYLTVDFDHGCTVVWKSMNAIPFGDYGNKDPKDIDWKYLQDNQFLLKLVSPEDFVKLVIKE